LTKIIEKEINLERVLEFNRNELNERFDFNPLDAYKAIEPRGPDYPIDFKALTNFIKKTGEEISEEEVFAILRRFDRDLDAKLNLEEFKSIVVSAYPTAASSETRILKSSSSKKVLAIPKE
jgi:hypothetical protein